jgi:hypothetical protein
MHIPQLRRFALHYDPIPLSPRLAHAPGPRFIWRADEHSRDTPSYEQEVESPPAPMSIALQSHLMKPAERLAEIGDILAAGLMRLRLGKSSQLCSHLRESSLDFSAPESGHPTPQSRSVADA